MSKCDTEKLLQLLNKQLNLDGELEIFAHLDQCRPCREVVYLMSRERDGKFFRAPAREILPPGRRSHGQGALREL